jgi:hypothetical protein
MPGQRFQTDIYGPCVRIPAGGPTVSLSVGLSHLDLIYALESAVAVVPKLFPAHLHPPGVGRLRCWNISTLFGLASLTSRYSADYESYSNFSILLVLPCLSTFLLVALWPCSAPLVPKFCLPYIRRKTGGGLLIHPDLFARTDFHFFC